MTKLTEKQIAYLDSLRILLRTPMLPREDYLDALSGTDTTWWAMSEEEQEAVDLYLQEQDRLGVDTAYPATQGPRTLDD